MKKYSIFIAILLFGILSLGFLSGRVHKDYYKADVKSVSVITDDDGWKITGDTKAPNGYYIIGISDEGGDLTTQLITALYDPTGISKVHKGHFTATVSGIDATSGYDEWETGETAKVHIVAVSPKLFKSKSIKDGIDEISSSMSDSVQDYGSIYKFTLSQSQVDYINDDDTDSNDDSDNYTDDDTDSNDDSDSDAEDESDDDINEVIDDLTNSDSSKNTYTPVDIASYARYSKKYLYENVSVQGTISKIQTDEDNECTLIDLTDSNYDHDVIIEIPDTLKDKMDYTPQEYDIITVSGSGASGYTSTNKISDTTQELPGIAADDITFIGTN